MSIEHRKLTDQELIEQYRQELLERNRQLGIEQTLEYIREYGHLFVLEGEDVTQSIAHSAAVSHLKSLLEWLLHDQNVGISDDMLLFLPGVEESKAGADLAVIDNLVIDVSNTNKSYGVWENGPPPRVAFEIASESTWRNDVSDKLDRYRLLQIHEYFTYDPHSEQVWKGEWLERGRLVGWRLNPFGEYEELQKDEQGRLWSMELDRYIKVEFENKREVPEQGAILNLYDLAGNKQLTEAQAERQKAEKADERTALERQRANIALLQADDERQRANIALLQADDERQRANAALLQADDERQRADEARRQADDERQRAEDAMRRIQELEDLLSRYKPET